MRLYLVRHATAQPDHQNPRRPLSERGRQEVAKIAEFIRDKNVKIGALWHSTKLRAIQTAEILAPALQIDQGVLQREGLSPNDPIAPIQKEIETCRSDLMIVGHLPFVSLMASKLLTGNSGSDIISFYAATIVCLEGEGDNWRLAWMITPDLLG